MVHNKEILLKEWEQRYESYRQYRGHYITVLSTALTAGLLLLGYIITGNLEKNSKLVILSLHLAVFLTLIVAHRIARKHIRKLGERLDALELALGMEDFHTTALLESTLAATLVWSWGMVLISMVSFIWILMRQ